MNDEFSHLWPWEDLLIKADDLDGPTLWVIQAATWVNHLLLTILIFLAMAVLLIICNRLAKGNIDRDSFMARCLSIGQATFVSITAATGLGYVMLNLLAGVIAQARYH